jgi:hypothetical protein
MRVCQSRFVWWHYFVSRGGEREHERREKETRGVGCGRDEVGPCHYTQGGGRETFHRPGELDHFPYATKIVIGNTITNTTIKFR